MLIGGLGIAFAVATSSQPSLQLAIAGVLSVTGAINLWVSRRLREVKVQSLTVSAAATMTLITYLGIIGDVSEPLLLHALYLALLAGLAYRRRSVQATA